MCLRTTERSARAIPTHRRTTVAVDHALETLAHSISDHVFQRGDENLAEDKVHDCAIAVCEEHFTNSLAKRPLPTGHVSLDNPRDDLLGRLFGLVSLRMLAVTGEIFHDFLRKGKLKVQVIWAFSFRLLLLAGQLTWFSKCSSMRSSAFFSILIV